MNAHAQEYVRSLDLSGTPRSIVYQDAAAIAGENFDQAKAQTQLVGSTTFSFAAGVEADIRTAISNSALLAQLVANKQENAAGDPLKWYEAYVTVLQNIGWVVQQSGFTDCDTQGTQVEVNQEILTVMTAVLGPSPAALAIITATVQALKNMQPGSPWLTLFSRETQKASSAHFQIGLVDKDANGQTFVAMCAFVLESNQNITQVLFFKWKEAHARFRANTANVSLNVPSLKDLNDTIVQKTRAYQNDYLSSIVDL